MNGQFTRMFWLCAQVAVLSACENQGGIEGSGNETSFAVTSSGVVTALGSVVVNNVEYGLSDAEITINGAPALEGDIAPGHIVIVEGERDPSGTASVAKRVSVEIAAAGPVSGVDVALAQLTILGQTIALDESTIIVDSVDGMPLGGLEIGQDVEVSGFADSSGVLYATRIEKRRAATPLLVSGVVANLDSATSTLQINGQVVDFSTAVLSGLESLAEDMRIRVASEGPASSVLIASAIALRSAGLPGTAGAEAMLQGWITRFASASDFDVDGHPVVSSLGANVIVGLNAFVSVDGALSAAGAVHAASITGAAAPGRIVGSVVIDGVDYGISGLMSNEGLFRLNIESPSSGPPVEDTGLAQLVGGLTVSGKTAIGNGVLIGEGCGLPSAGRFCGTRTAARFEVTKTGPSFDDSAFGELRLTTDNGEEVMPLWIGHWGGVPGFTRSGLWHTSGLFDMHQAEFAQNGGVVLSLDEDHRLFFQSAPTGCTGNGVITDHGDGSANLYDVTLTVEACTDSLGYLNADFEGMATLEGFTPWDYGDLVLSMWLSTADAAPPAAISLWSLYVQ